MARSVKVLLEAQTRDYIAEVKAAERATEDLGDELSELKTKGASLEVVAKQADHAGEALEDLKTDSDKAGESLKDTAVDAGLASEAIDDVGDSARKAAREVEKLDREIDQARSELRGLAADFVDADEASRADLTKGIAALEAKLRDLRKSRNILKELIPGPGPGPDPSPDPADPIKKLVGPSLKSLGIAAGIAIGTPLTPILGAAIAGAVVGAVGVGGIIGGVAAAASHPEIKARAKQLGKTYLEGLKGEAEDAFAQPIMDALDQLDEWGGSALPKLGQFFDNVAPGLDHLVESLIGFSDALLDSFVYSSERAEEPMRALGDLIQTTGEAVGDLIEDLSDHSAEGASALDDLAAAISFTVGAISGGLTMLADTYAWFDKQTDLLLAGVDQVTDYAYGIAGQAAAADLAVAATTRLSSATLELTEDQSAAARAARGHRDALVELSEEMRAETDPIFGLMDAQQDLADATKKSAEATAEHGADSAEAEKALRDLVKAAIELQGAAGELGETFDGEVSAGLRATLRSAGLTNTQIDRLEKQFREAKGAAEGFAKDWKAEVSVKGVVDSAKNVRALRSEISKLRGKTIPINVRVTQYGEITYGNQASAYKAEGGPIEGPGTGTSDDVPIMASNGEHMWTAAEVQAAGGHQAMEQMRAAVLAGAGASTSRTQMMPAAAAQRVVVEVSGGIDLSRADSTAFGQLLASTLRTKSAIRQEVKSLLNQS